MREQTQGKLQWVAPGLFDLSGMRETASGPATGTVECHFSTGTIQSRLTTFYAPTTSGPANCSPA